MAPKKKAIPVAVERTEICRECRHAHMDRTDGLRCRRYPPSFVYDYTSGTNSVQWPEVNGDHYCGEFAAQLSS
jgi:hypothetical protein